MVISSYSRCSPPLIIPSSHSFISAPKPRFPSYRNSKCTAIQLSELRNLQVHAKIGESDQSNSQIEVVVEEEEAELANSASNGAASSSTSLLSFLCPLLKLFSATDPSQERNHTFEVATSSISSLARFPWGSKSLPDNSISRYVPLQLYEFEACPFCRRVREALTELDLSVEVYPCPKGSLRHREVVRRSGGKEQFPYLMDPNTGVSMYESDQIVKYLFSQYGKGRQPSTGLLESTLFTGWMPTILRAGRGMTLWENAKRESPPQKLKLFSYENNPYARIVREALCELEIPYILQNVGEGSNQMQALLQASGSTEVPYIIDPNTGAQMGDYKNILAYLFSTYNE
ncbi:hypothetical protein V2J09_002534 [Rumex salicifolius]